MRFLRKKFISKTITIFFLIIFLQSVFQPMISYALTTGPHQPEYTSYEAPGSTDMVNLSTGNFTFSLPLLEVPSPEGGFSLPLSYHAGIGLEQEASWVGLGWTMNPGAITRSINSFPDDAAGESQNITVQDLNVVRGWTSSICGLGTMGWNNNIGNYGQVGFLGLSWDNDGYKVDPIKLGMTIMAVVSTVGAVGVLTSATSTAGQALRAAEGLGKQLVSVAQGISNNIDNAAIPNSPTEGSWQYTRKVKQKLFHKEYRIWLDQSRREKMFGTLYLGKVTNYVAASPSPLLGVNYNLKIDNVSEQLYEYPKSTTTNEGSASDINYTSTSPNYADDNNPSFLGYDDYSVMAPGVSGSISPYRLDVGSAATPREMTKYHTRYAPVKFQDYKVPFVYQGSLSNSYTHHIGNQTSTFPDFKNGVSTSFASGNFTFSLADNVYKSERIRTDISSTKKIPQANHIEWLTNNDIKNPATLPAWFMDFLPAADRVNFRNNFLGSSQVPSTFSTSTSNFQSAGGLTLQLNSSVIADFSDNQQVTLNIDFYANAAAHDSGTGAIRQSYTVIVQSKNTTSYTIVTSNSTGMFPYHGYYADIDIVYNKLPQIAEGIGAYSITSADGTTYHFALAVYDFDFKSEMRDVNYPTTKKSLISRGSPFANTWLLTAITGPDFIDRNDNGLPDESDWGSWLKFNYGKYSDAFQYRMPYTGFKRSSDNLSESYVQGTKQLYYLNSIESRSHVALFLKSTRNDSRSANTSPVSSMKLDEICLVTQDSYKKLITPTVNGGFGLPAFSNQFSNVCLTSQFTTTPIANFKKQNCVKRILFTYNYSLCPGTPNSNSSGKLTLNRISILGKNDQLAVPDYKFVYGNNPSYNVNRWDGWGMYNSTGATGVNTHNPSSLDADGSAWSLTKVTTPLGSEINVNYERDTYSSVSGERIYANTQSFSNPTITMGSPIDLDKLFVPSVANYSTGDQVEIQGGYTSFTCPSTGTSINKPFSGVFTISAVGSNYIKLSGTDYMGVASACGGSQSGPLTMSSQYGSILKVAIDKKGGDLRVGSIVMKNEVGVELKTRYLYNKDDGTSSGVVSKEPEYSRNGGYNYLYDLPLYPNTPVLYGKVSVLNGKLITDADYHTKTVYEFEVPQASMITQQKVTVMPRTEVYSSFEDQFTEVYQHNITNKTSRIGSLKSVKTYEQSNSTPVATTTMEYTDDQILNEQLNNKQGIYSDGVLVVERVEKNAITNQYNKANRTSVLHYPYSLKKVTKTKDGFTSEEENVSWDFITGSVLEKNTKSHLGVIIKTVSQPAYTVAEYATLGSKATNISNRNMLAQIAATYTYRINSSGTVLGLVYAEAQKWNSSWTNYREYNSGTQTYEDGNAEGEVWRKGAAYSWKGTFTGLNDDGTQDFNPSSDKFSFSTSAINPNWMYLGETDRYDHFSYPLAARDLNGLYSSSKRGYNQQIVVAQASNASYNEICFSGAEDLEVDKPFFGGEVAKGAGSVVSSPVHTGIGALSLSTGYGFVYKNSIQPNKLYRASVWTNSPNGRIYYKMNNGSEVIPALLTTAGTKPYTQVSSAVSKIDQTIWYRVDVVIQTDGSPNPEIEVGVKALSGTVVFDDFRFQPMQSVMSASVIDPITQQLTYSLNNDNLFTRYEYNDRGLLIKTYSESLSYGEKLVSESKDNYRRFHVNQ